MQVRVRPLEDFGMQVWVQFALLLGLFPGMGLGLCLARGTWPTPDGGTVWFALALALGSVTCLGFAIRRLRAVYRLNRCGIAVRATVVRWETRNIRWNTGWITLEYHYAGKTYTPALGIDKKEGDAGAARGWVPVVIDPAAPAMFAVAVVDDAQGA